MSALAILLAVPLVGGLLLWALGERDSAPEANAAFSFATFVAAAWLTVDVVSTGPIRAFDRFPLSNRPDSFLYVLQREWRLTAWSK